VLQRFHMVYCKPLRVPISMDTKLSIEKCPKTSKEMEDMTYLPYFSAVGILMYVMVYTRPNIVQVVRLFI